MPSDNAAIKTQIVDAIAKSDDPQLKTVLLLMLHMQEEISNKIDTILSDDKLLRELVLNGTAEDHDADHHWVKERRLQTQEIEADHKWVRDRRATDLDNKESSRKIRDGIIQSSIWACLAAAATFILTKMT